MKLDSPLFDSIRVKPSADRKLKTSFPACDWAGCEKPGAHRAPKGRGKENEYHQFCIDHVRAYNANYNYFSGMDDDAVASFQKDASIGHRPTWKMGSVGGKKSAKPRFNRFEAGVANDPFEVIRDLGGTGPSPRREDKKAEAERRTVRNAERKALGALGLEEGARKPEIKARFHELVKRHHPDHNDGDRSMEERLVEVIQAYNYLKSTGVC